MTPCGNHFPRSGTLKNFLIAGAVLLVLPFSLKQVNGAERLTIEHPFRNPQKYSDHKRCDNCGMDRNKWARTRYEFNTAKGAFYTCSLACVAIMSMKLKEEPRDVKVADYLHPMRMLDADKAFYVMGSAAPGTMTKISKIAFSDEKGAVAFAAQYGGRAVRFKDVLAAARKEVSGRM
jgi:nitrous oxide reductase accessory protein NosL